MPLRLLQILILSLGLTAVVPGFAASAQVAIQNVSLIDGTGAPAQERRTVLVEEGRIVAIFETGSRALPAGTRVIDLPGHTLMPGLIDAHVHLSARRPSSSDGAHDGSAISSGREAALSALLRSGVTTVRELAGDARVTAALRRRQVAGELEAPAIHFAALFFGPRFLDDPRARISASGHVPGTAPWSRAVTAELDLDAAMAAARASGATGVKLYASLTGEQLAELSRQAHRHGLLVWIHSAVFPSGAAEAVAAGADSLIHAKGLVTVAGTEGIPDNFADGTRQWMMSRPFGEIDPSGPLFQSLYAQMARQGTILEPALVADGDRAAQPLPPPRAAMREWACRATAAADRAGVAIGAGTDSTMLEPGMLQRELARLVECGLTPLESIRAATQTNARALGIADTHGTVEIGKAADLMVVAGDPAQDIQAANAVRLVMQAGRLVVEP